MNQQTRRTLPKARVSPAPRVATWALAATLASALLPAGVNAQARPHKPSAKAPFVPCALGTFNCAKRPVTYALCRANALLAFYQPGLPTDSLGRDDAITYIQAMHVDSSNRTIERLDGDVTLRRYDQLLHAGHLAYNDVTTAYDARGHVTYQDSGQLLAASRVRGTTTPDHAVATDVRYQLLVSRGNGTAAQAELVDPTHSRYDDATYSTCDPDDRVWEFRAKSITTNKATGVGVARDATMRIGNVPFMWLPYFSFPIDDRRKSGFLYPTFGNNGNSGFLFSIPYYLNLAPNYDATLTPQLYTRRGLMLGGQFRYLAGASLGQLDFDYLPNDRRAGSDNQGHVRDIADGADRYFVQFADRTGLGGNWNFTTSIKTASDKYYFQDFQSGLKGYATPSTLSSNAYVSDSGEWWNASFGADYNQNVDPIVGDASTQYNRWPRATFDIDVPLARNFDWGMTSEAVAFRKNADVVQGNRLDLYPYLAADFQGPAWYVRPRVAWRYTTYELVDNPERYGYTDASPSRSLPIASIDSGLIFERNVAWFGSKYTQTLEPRLYYLYVPYRNQRNLPVFDSMVMTFGYWELFTPNRFSGADRQMDANNLTAALTTRLLDPNGVQQAAFSFGQIHYFSRQQVQLGSASPATDFSGSDYVAQLDLSLDPDWRLNSVYQWDPDGRRTSVGTLGVQRRIGTDGILNFSYRYRIDYMEQFDASAIIPVNPHWRLLARWNVALRQQDHWARGEPKTLAALFGVEYEGCCVAVRLLGRHYVRDVHGDTDNAVMFEIQFKGLGSFSPQTADFLHRAILGYQ